MNQRFLSTVGLAFVTSICSLPASHAQTGITSLPASHGQTGITSLAASHAQTAITSQPAGKQSASCAISQSASFETIVAAVRANPSDLGLRRYLAQALIKKGLTVKAAEQMRSVIAVNGANSDDLILLGDASRYSGDFQSAIQSYRKALTLNPMSSKARTGLSLAYASSGDLKSAYDICQNGLAQLVDPRDRAEMNKTLLAIREMDAAKIASNQAPIAY